MCRVEQTRGISVTHSSSEDLHPFVDPSLPGEHSLRAVNGRRLLKNPAGRVSHVDQLQRDVITERPNSSGPRDCPDANGSRPSAQISVCGPSLTELLTTTSDSELIGKDDYVMAITVAEKVLIAGGC